MLFRVRTTLTDRPGALAALTSRCGEAGLNVLGLQIFPALGQVTDEVVLSAPHGWTAGAVARLVGGAGGDEVSVEACTTHDLLDQPVRWLTAAADLAAGSDPEELLTRLLGPHRERWSATEHSRAAALRSLAERLDRPGSRVPAPRGRTTPVQYAEASGPDAVEARIGRHVVGRARLTPAATEAGVVELAIEVDPSWRRLGIGTTLLHRACALAARAGAGELVLSASEEDGGFVTMVCASGMRARIRCHGGRVVARVTLAAPTGAVGSASGRGVSRG